MNINSEPKIANIKEIKKFHSKLSKNLNNKNKIKKNPMTYSMNCLHNELIGAKNHLSLLARKLSEFQENYVVNNCHSKNISNNISLSVIIKIY